MINYYEKKAEKMTRLDDYTDGCWVCCIEPKEEEVSEIISRFHIEPEFLRASLDEEETPHIDYEEGNTLIMVDIPFVEKEGKNLRYYTIPLGIILTENNIITVCLKDSAILAEFTDGAVRAADPKLKTQFVLHMMLRISSKYLQYLKQIDKKSDVVEQELKRSMNNKGLLELLEVEKSLVYFSYSLKTDQITLEKIRRGRAIPLFDEDRDLLEDVLIEFTQAIEMSNIHLNIISGTADAFGSIISNNLNIVMKVLASITLIISIPTVISGIYGMNNPNLPMLDYWWFPIALTVLLMIIATVILKKKGML